MLAEQDHSRLVSALQRGACYPHACDEVRLIETHISSVLLAGDYAYKLKKPLDLGFLDYSTLAKRKHCCQQELRLNRRLAPALYLAVVAITGSIDRPRVDGDGDAIEYAVKMRRFEPDQQLDALLSRTQVSSDMIDRVASQVAAFHQSIAVADPQSAYGQPEAVLAPMLANFKHLRQLLTEPDQLAPLATLETWTRGQFTQLQARLQQRKQQGFIRECHGDMHLGNIACIDGEAVIFDGIEFNADLRWIDVISELAFLVMDLEDRGAQHLAHIALYSYLAHSGDYEGVALLRFYQVYRAMVRAKVACIRLAQPGLSDDEVATVHRHYQNYIELAQSYTKPAAPTVWITHGLSGSGKSTVARKLVACHGVIQLRSDIERKRLFSMPALARSGAAIDQGIYDPAITERTYQRLLALTAMIGEAGMSVIVDATFLQRRQRRLFQQLAEQKAWPFLVIDCVADEPTLHQRIDQRLHAGNDASEATAAVLVKQMASDEPVAEDEPVILITDDSDSGLEKIISYSSSS